MTHITPLTDEHLEPLLHKHVIFRPFKESDREYLAKLTSDQWKLGRFKTNLSKSKSGEIYTQYLETLSQYMFTMTLRGNIVGFVAFSTDILENSEYFSLKQDMARGTFIHLTSEEQVGEQASQALDEYYNSDYSLETYLYDNFSNYLDFLIVDPLLQGMGYGKRAINFVKDCFYTLELLNNKPHKSIGLIANSECNLDFYKHLQGREIRTRQNNLDENITEIIYELPISKQY